MHWLRDYGTFLAAVVAALAALWTAWRQSRRARAEWLRDLRLPRYLSFLKATKDYETTLSVYHLLWEAGGLGPAPSAPSKPEAETAFRHALSEVSLVGPDKVTAAAEVVQQCVWQWDRYLERIPGAMPGSLAVSKATDNFTAAAQDALAVKRTVVPFDELTKMVDALGTGDNLEEQLIEDSDSK